jgi:hypothetical protein
VQRCGSAEMCRVGQRGYAEEMQHRCRDVEVQSAEVQSAGCRGAEVQWCSGAEVQRCSIGVEI